MIIRSQLINHSKLSDACSHSGLYLLQHEGYIVRGAYKDTTKIINISTYSNSALAVNHAQVSLGRSSALYISHELVGIVGSERYGNEVRGFEQGNGFIEGDDEVFLRIVQRDAACLAWGCSRLRHCYTHLCQLHDEVLSFQAVQSTIGDAIEVGIAIFIGSGGVGTVRRLYLPCAVEFRRGECHHVAFSTGVHT